MCRKDFMGYICGHCSLPRIIPCPITLSNPRFPLCKFIAEIPMWVESYCEPCQRVAFTQNVLLKEKIHMEQHREKKCPCGNDYTEEERQQTKARLLAEKERGKGVAQVTRPVSGKRQETHQPRNQTQGNHSRLEDRERSGPQQQFSGDMGHLNQYLNAPYGQHPMQPIPTYQPFHPYNPQHAFVGMEVSPSNQYRGRHKAFPFVNGTSFNTEPVMTFGEPSMYTEETQMAKAPDIYSAEDCPVQELPAENQFLPAAEESPPDIMKFIASPVLISSGIVLPPRPHSCPRYEPAKEWDTISQ